MSRSTQSTPGASWQQCATPRELYDKPANVFVGGFIGSPAMNLHKMSIVDGGVSFGGIHVPLDRDTLSAAHAEGSNTVTLGFRPGSVERDTHGDGFAATVDLVEELGSDAFCYASLHEGHLGYGDADVVARIDPRDPPRPGERINLRIRHEEQHAFSSVTGNRLTG